MRMLSAVLFGFRLTHLFRVFITISLGPKVLNINSHNLHVSLKTNPIPLLNLLQNFFLAIKENKRFCMRVKRIRYVCLGGMVETDRNIWRVNCSSYFILMVITPWPLVRKRTIPTERRPLVGEVSSNFCG
jgi:hypothetical protein